MFYAVRDSLSTDNGTVLERQEHILASRPKEKEKNLRTFFFDIKLCFALLPSCGHCLADEGFNSIHVSFSKYF